ncbi:hypothetical protein SELMODRAFT_417056 [Selaginella moellendorffii]|uniref:F-box domain-containing protein n=1 Tax=Selaginella moellendorffii TaxID=88036 RepID=D8S181_SELML|nr:hypothetical protein SELMODRAFT_417056 [Selaginella moellendorffii]
MTLLPVRILREILSRLDNRSAVRASSVCKAWREIVQSPDFKSRATMDSGVWILTYVNDALKAWCPLSGSFLDDPFPDFKDHYQVLGTNQGMVFLRSRTKLYVGNPVLMQWEELPAIDKMLFNTDSQMNDGILSSRIELCSERERYVIIVINKCFRDNAVMYTPDLRRWRTCPFYCFQTVGDEWRISEQQEIRSYPRDFYYEGRRMLEVIAKKEFSIWEERDASTPKASDLSFKRIFYPDPNEWKLLTKVAVAKREEYEKHTIGSLRCFWSKKACPKLRPFVVDLETMISYVFPRKHTGRDKFSSIVFVLIGNTIPIPKHFACHCHSSALALFVAMPISTQNCPLNYGCIVNLLACSSYLSYIERMSLVGVHQVMERNQDMGNLYAQKKWHSLVTLCLQSEKHHKTNLARLLINHKFVV